MHRNEVQIMDVVMKNNIHITGRAGASHRATCPFCGGRSTLSITPSQNLFQCFLCGQGGNAAKLDFLCNPDDYDGDDSKNYVKFLKNMGNFNGAYTPEERSFEVNERTSDETCSSVYKAMLSLLTLRDNHKKDLLRRGLTEEDVRRFLFKSAPQYKDRYKIPKVLINMGFQLDGVPGFFIENGKWCVKTPKGYLCPVFDGHRNLILGFQVRVDEPIDGNKYTWFSSTGKEQGTSSGALGSILPGEYDNTAVIVEGTLKGLVTYCLLKGKVTILTVPGTKAIKSLEPAYAMYHGHMLFEAYDMDKYPTFSHEPQTEEEEAEIRHAKNIMDSIPVLEKSCEMNEIFLHNLTWNFQDGAWSGEGKGIDDFLLDYEYPQKFSEYVIAKSEKFIKIKKTLC